MDKILDQLKHLNPRELTYSSLGKLLGEIDFTKVDYQNYVPEFPIDTYGRNILLMEPLECVVISWPAGVQSAIHHHNGFWGYVAVVEGQCDNMEYELKGGVLKESLSLRGIKGGLIPEPDGVIHKLGNTGKEPAVTIHFYSPALNDLGGMRLFDTEKKRIGTLNNKAKSASWSEPAEHFESIEENAFDFEAKSASHKIYPVIPKPLSDQINAMVSNYYSEQANSYDGFDLSDNIRNTYTKTVNRLVANDIVDEPIHNMLVVACGTGRRALEIQKMARKNYSITGVDVSGEMCKIARSRGINAIASSWLEADFSEQFDAATFLYAFGHVPNSEERKKALVKLNHQLKVGAPLYLDLFNIKDNAEWGPRVVKFFETNELDKFGYEKGDVFYKKNEGESLAYLHYFSQEDAVDLIASCGFNVECVQHIGYSKHSGQLLNANDQGAIFIKAIKTKAL